MRGKGPVSLTVHLALLAMGRKNSPLPLTQICAIPGTCRPTTDIKSRMNRDGPKYSTEVQCMQFHCHLIHYPVVKSHPGLPAHLTLKGSKLKQRCPERRKEYPSTKRYRVYLSNASFIFIGGCCRGFCQPLHCVMERARRVGMQQPFCTF